ncbi:MAG: helix-turn-helix domain-containing protein [Ferruginibacter sp.]|nr:helix-turn-helix domain-containing protein [Ferruginibacter sp.]
METILIPVEKEIKQWMKEAMKEYFEETKSSNNAELAGNEPLVSRKEIASFLDISLVTLHDWIKRGLPSHKQRGRVYFMRSEVLEHIKMKQLEK